MAFYNTQNERNFRVIDPFLRVTHDVEELRLQLNSCNVDIGLNCCATGSRGPFFLPNTGTIAIGCEAANSTTGSFGYQDIDAIAIGHQAGQFSQQSRSIAIGLTAGQLYQDENSVAIGSQAGQYNQENLAVAIGRRAGQTNQQTRSIAIGADAGYLNQTDRCVAIGRWAGYENQGTGSDDTGYSTAVGPYSGQIDQGTYSVAIGADAGYEYQQPYATALGSQAGDFTQGTGSVAIGYQAGYEQQGEYCIAIGHRAGQSNQPANSIILSANESPINSNNSGFYVNPIRTDIVGYNLVPLMYAPSTSEICIANTTPSEGQVLRTVMYSVSDLGQAATTSIGGSWVDVFSISYTPVCTSSRLIVEYCTKFYFAGANGDNCASRIQVDSSDISQGIQYASNDGAGRSSILFPLMGRYNNGNLSAKTITAGAIRTAGDDTLDVYGDLGTWLKITEIFRVD